MSLFSDMIEKQSKSAPFDAVQDLAHTYFVVYFSLFRVSQRQTREWCVLGEQGQGEVWALIPHSAKDRAVALCAKFHVRKCKKESSHLHFLLLKRQQVLVSVAKQDWS